MAGCLQSDEARWPLIVLTAPVQWGAETVARYAEETSRHVECGQPFALVLDLSSSALLPTSARSKLIAHRRWLFSHRTTPLVCEAVVIRSRAQREFFTVPHEGNARPQRFFATPDEAVDYALRQLLAVGISLPAGAPRKSGVGFKPRKTSGPPILYQDDQPPPHAAGKR